MKKLNLLFVMMLLVAIPALQSCNDDDGYSVGDIGVAMGTIRVNGGSYYLLSDRGTTIFPATSRPYGYQPVDGQRVYAVFNPLYDNYGGYDLGVNFEQIYNILTKQIEFLREDNEEEIGNDPVKLNQGLWIGGGYLNVSFLYPYTSTQRHRVSLVRNTLAETLEDGYIHLEYRQNFHGITTGTAYKGLVSFNLNSLEEDLANGAKGIKVKYLVPDGNTTKVEEKVFLKIDETSDQTIDSENIENEESNLQ